MENSKEVIEGPKVIAVAVYDSDRNSGKTHASSKKTQPHPGQAHASRRKKENKRKRKMAARV